MSEEIKDENKEQNKQLKLYFIYFITIYTNRLRIPYNTIYC